MQLDNRRWWFLFRITRSSGGLRPIIGCSLEQLTTDCGAAMADIAGWRAAEPNDDAVLVRWSIANGHRFAGSSVLSIGGLHVRRELDRLEECLAPPMMEAICFAVAAMTGQYGESEEWTIRPDSNKWEGMEDEA